MLKINTELQKENGALFKEIKKMSFGQFLFLYYFARNTPYTVCCEVLEKLKQRRNSLSNPVRKMNSSALPSYKSSCDHLETIGNAPPNKIPDESNSSKNTFGKGTRHQLVNEEKKRNRQGSLFVQETFFCSLLIFLK